MPKFRLKGGPHSEGGRIYREGDILESPHDLSQVHKGKFEKVHENEKVSKGQKSPEKGLAPVTQNDGKNHDTSRAGDKRDHTQGFHDDDVDTRPGAESHEDKHQGAHTAGPATGNKPKDRPLGKAPKGIDGDAKIDGVPLGEDVGDTNARTAEGTVENIAPDGEDVTDKFASAKENLFKVYKVKGNKFNVFEEDDLGKPLNDKPVDKTGVSKVVKDSLKNK